ncbi:3-phosphoshikimate 1-carboxyvinyltransferase [Devosia sp. YR412]|uniref:3-phosphoshikimate 1-carboxyvinyltransferase n=1 Tax=Devosia sp. YR412 TaxID=1881030 RepID=UPI0008D05BD2|nr:3-phosphoshikimate 1-carboxyvinyltransferase [Devosia sp. YR412]SEP59607.1 3-phosphoshikimate 1-carboxyvinyltransferase [Devosia sp. YR412]
MNQSTAQNPAPLSPLASHGASPLTGYFATPGDKAISHRALIIGALAVGRTTVEGLLDAEDVQSTAAALRQLGVRIDVHDGVCHVHGLGVGGLMPSPVRLDLGNSGTGLRLLLGLLAPYNFASRFTGGPTLTRRPLRALLDALAPIGVGMEETVEDGLPLTRRGPALPLPFHHGMEASSDQIKSALLLAAVQIAGTSTIVEPVATSDHTEKLLADFGAAISVTPDDTGGSTISITGLVELRPRHLVVPGDPASAGYAVVAALIVPGSDLVVENVLINPTRTGLIDTLLEMGGDIQFTNQREVGGEHVADLRVRSSRLKGIRVTADHAAMMLDDIPTLAVAAAFAQGETVIEGIAELRHQECDRLAATAAGLAANKVTVSEGEDSLTIGGGEGKVNGGGKVESRSDHRIAMSFLVLGLASKHKVTVDDTNAIAASFPGFVAAMTAVGGRFETVKGKKS